MKPIIPCLIVFAYTVFGAPVFVQQPSVSLENKKAVIRFEVSEATDVEVAILDARGKIVRHLAAGVLGGEYDPPPPLQPGLSQTLEWNGSDDYWLWPEDGPFRVRVRLGITPQYERSISTKVFGSGFTYGPGSVNPQEDFLTLDHPLLVKPSEPDYPLHGIPPKLDICVSDVTEELLVKSYKIQSPDFARFNGITGSLINIIDAFGGNMGYGHTGEHVFDWTSDYIYYTCSSPPGVIYRLNSNGTSAPYTATGKDVIEGLGQGSDIHCRGHAPGPDNSMYVIHYGGSISPDYQSVAKIKDGSILNAQLIQVDASLSGGVKVDLQGNVYLGARIKPKAQRVPEELSGKVAPSYIIRNSQGWWADEMYGSILKFPPSGGKIYKDPNGDLLGGRDGNYLLKAEGMTWMRFGYSHVLTHALARTKCWCNVTRFDVDRFGRVFYPNTFAYSFHAIDNSRNEIFRYRNRDFSSVPIGLGHQIEVTDRAMYIADFFNNQVVVFTLEAQTESFADLPSLSAEFTAGPAGTGIGLSNTPNPFSSYTKIAVSCQLSAISKVNLHIFNINGKIVKKLTAADSRQLIAGLTWNASKEPPGIYFCKLKYNNHVITRKMIFMQ